MASSLLIATALLLAAVASPSLAAVTDKFVPFCPPSSYVDPPTPLGWQRWSNVNTWPGKVIPGVGSKLGVDVDIPCGTGVILDMNVTLGTLNIMGSLKVSDSGPFQIFANFIVNQGRISIGSALTPYSGKFIVNITGTTNEYIITRDPQNPQAPINSPRSLGVRAVITLGGQWDVNGMYGNAPGWTKLASMAKAGSSSITVQGNVGAWPVGGEIAIASTDFDYRQAERLRITSVRVNGSNTVLGLSSPLAWMHWGGPLYTGVASTPTMDQSAEVLLLTRTIVIQGHPNPINPLIGGHFIINQTPAKQSIIGLELNNMGQQGNLARYPMHFHLCQDVTGSLVQGLAIHDSNQRCLVVHGSWNALVVGNGAFQTKGHCFIVEDGIEFGNSFIGNLGFSQEPPSVLIPTSGGPTDAIVSDNAPATFWITNGNNTFVNNIAAGCFDSGYWFEGPSQVAGPSSLFPQSVTVFPKYIPLRNFTGNVAHSNGRAGLRSYPSGYRPRFNGGASMDQASAGPNAAPANMTIKSFRAWKNDFIGMFIHETDSLIIDGLISADNGATGLELNRAQGIYVMNSIFLGETDNVGNPVTCGIRQSGCRPYLTASSPNAFNPNAGCVIPTKNDPSIARSQHDELLPNGDLFGILVDADDYPSHGRQGAANHFYNLTFGKFFSYCRNAAAGISANGQASAFWNAAISTRGIKMIDSTAPLWFVRPNQGHLSFEPTPSGDAGPMSYFFVMHDEDGSIVGGNGGYAVTANSPAILPTPLVSNCTSKPLWNGYSCPGSCYRSVYIQGGNYVINRLADNAAVANNGSLFVNLAANTIYRVTFKGAIPQSFSIQYMDMDSGCLNPVVLQIAAPSGGFWQVAPGSSNVFWQACMGVSAPFSKVTQTLYSCDSAGNSILQITMGSDYSNVINIFNQNGAAPRCSYLQCGVFMAQSYWYYNDTARPVDFLRTVFRPGGYRIGRAAFGFGGVGENTTIAYPSANMVTKYFRQSFNLQFAGCINKLLFGYIASDAIVVYLNGAEIFRTNLPSGAVGPATVALADVNPRAPWSTFNVTAGTVWLTSGVNHIQVELHVFSSKALEAKFDMWMAASGQNCPRTQFFNPKGQATVLQALM